MLLGLVSFVYAKFSLGSKLYHIEVLVKELKEQPVTEHERIREREQHLIYKYDEKCKDWIMASRVLLACSIVFQLVNLTALLETQLLLVDGPTKPEPLMSIRVLALVIVLALSSVLTWISLIETWKNFRKPGIKRFVIFISMVCQLSALTAFLQSTFLAPINVKLQGLNVEQGTALAYLVGGGVVVT